jgi:hypothetical protein
VLPVLLFRIVIAESRVSGLSYWGLLLPRRARRVVLQTKSCKMSGTDGEEESSGTPVCRAEDEDSVWKIVFEDGDLRLVLQHTVWLPGLGVKQTAQENVD